MQSTKPSLSVILPAYNEEQILAPNLAEVHAYMLALATDFDWEMLIVNDGSGDRTGQIAEDFARSNDNVRVVHHDQNRGLGNATKTGIQHCTGDKIVILDIDLSYDVSHIGRLLDTLVTTGADVVLASPYMKGGEIANVPVVRRLFSVAANKFLSVVAHGSLSTLTCMVRGFDANFARSLVLRSTGMEVMPETVYKSMILRGRLVEIPATLNWGLQVKESGRTSSMRIFRQIIGTLLSGFFFRPFMFFVVPGLLLFVFSSWVNVWMFIHFLDSLALAPASNLAERVSWAIADAYQSFPHTFIVGLLSMMLAVQLISLGILALQSKSYFEEIFYLGSKMAGRTISRRNVD